MLKSYFSKNSISASFILLQLLLLLNASQAAFPNGFYCQLGEQCKSGCCYYQQCSPMSECQQGFSLWLIAIFVIIGIIVVIVVIWIVAACCGHCDCILCCWKESFEQRRIQRRQARNNNNNNNNTNTISQQVERSINNNNEATTYQSYSYQQYLLQQQNFVNQPAYLQQQQKIKLEQALNKTYMNQNYLPPPRVDMGDRTDSRLTVESHFVKKNVNKSSQQESSKTMRQEEQKSVVQSFQIQSSVYSKDQRSQELQMNQNPIQNCKFQKKQKRSGANPSIDVSL